MGNIFGVVFDGASLTGQPRTFTLGRAWSVADGTGYASVATASGSILYFNTGGNNDLAGTISFSASQLSASTDGTVLAAAANDNYAQYGSADRNVDLYSLPSGAVTGTFVYSTPQTSRLYMSMSGAASVLAEQFESPSSACLTQVIPIAGGGPIFATTPHTRADLSRQYKAYSSRPMAP